jgi:hypothetical protein
MKMGLDWRRLITYLKNAAPSAEGLFPGNFPTALTAEHLYNYSEGRKPKDIKKSKRVIFFPFINPEKILAIMIMPL